MWWVDEALLYLLVLLGIASIGIMVYCNILLSLERLDDMEDSDE